MLGHTVIYLCKSGSKKGSFCIVDTQKKSFCIVLHRERAPHSGSLEETAGGVAGSVTSTVYATTMAIKL